MLFQPVKNHMMRPTSGGSYVSDKSRSNQNANCENKPSNGTQYVEDLKPNANGKTKDKTRDLGFRTPLVGRKRKNTYNVRSYTNECDNIYGSSYNDFLTSSFDESGLVRFNENVPPETPFGSLINLNSAFCSMPLLFPAAIRQPESRTGKHESDTSETQKDLTTDKQKGIFRRLLPDVTVFRHPMFPILVWVNGMSLVVGLFYIYLPMLTGQVGLSTTDATVCQTIMSISDVSGKALITLLVHWVRRGKYIFLIGQVLNIAACAWVVFTTELWTFIVISILFGFLTGGIHAIGLTLTIEYLGPKHFAQGLGMLGLVQGVIMMISNTFLGLARDLTGDARYMFYIILGIQVTIVIVCLFEPLALKRGQSRYTYQQLP